MPPARSFPPKLPEWVVDGRIPRHGMTLIAGFGGLGKSTYLVWLAAQASQGLLTGRHERVMLAHVEDDRQSITTPRLIAAGADLDLISYPEIERLRLPRDLDALAQEIGTVRPDILMIDPLSAIVDHIGHGSGRANIDKLLDVTDELGVTVIAAHHLIKSGREIAGGAGVSASARAIHIFRSVPLRAVPQIISHLQLDDVADLDALSVLVPRKNSYGKLATPLVMRREVVPHPADPHSDTITTYSVVCELTPDTGTHDEDVVRKNTVREKAKNLIVRLLAGRPCSAKELETAMLADGYKPEERLHRLCRGAGRGDRVDRPRVTTWSGQPGRAAVAETTRSLPRDPA